MKISMGLQSRRALNLVVLHVAMILLLTVANTRLTAAQNDSGASSGTIQCGSAEIAHARETGFILLPGSERITTSVWTFCDGIEVTEKHISKQTDTSYLEKTIKNLDSDPNLEKRNRYDQDGRILAFYRARVPGKEWTLVARVDTATHIFRGESLIHVVLLEKLRTCGR